MVLFHHFFLVFHPALFLPRHFRPDKNNVPAIPVNSSPPDHHPNQITTQRSSIIERFNNVRSSPIENPPFRAGAKIFTFHRPSLIFQPLLNPQVKIHPLWSGQRFSSTHHPSPIFTPSHLHSIPQCLGSGKNFHCSQPVRLRRKISLPHSHATRQPRQLVPCTPPPKHNSPNSERSSLEKG